MGTRNTRMNAEEHNAFSAFIRVFRVHRLRAEGWVSEQLFTSLRRTQSRMKRFRIRPLGLGRGILFETLRLGATLE
jgi:hypothetical protein